MNFETEVLAVQNLSFTNPTVAVDLDFGHYLESRNAELSSHLVGGIPDYAFSLDQQLRQQIASMGPVRAIAKALVSFVVPIQKQLQQMNSVAVGPQQYPEIHSMGEECAHKLGIGIPQIFVYFDPHLNGFTFATEDVAPMIVLTSALVEALEPQELKFVIGHECGHIHNLHSVYNTAVELLVNPLAGVMLGGIPALGALRAIVQTGLVLFLARWSRCAEVTCDRAGLICCGDVTAAQVALAKLAMGGGDRLKGINIQEYLKQIQQVQSTPVRLMELTKSHPLTPKRLEAIRLFVDCDVLHSWRPELRSPTSVRSKAETDDLCEQFISVFAQGYKSQTI